VLPLAQKLHQADMYRVHDAVDEGLDPEFIEQLADGGLRSLYRAYDPLVTGWWHHNFPPRPRHAEQRVWPRLNARFSGMSGRM
jgi:hypothetical protein